MSALLYHHQNNLHIDNRLLPAMIQLVKSREIETNLVRKVVRPRSSTPLSSFRNRVTEFRFLANKHTNKNYGRCPHGCEPRRNTPKEHPRGLAGISTGPKSLQGAVGASPACAGPLGWIPKLFWIAPSRKLRIPEVGGARSTSVRVPMAIYIVLYSTSVFSCPAVSTLWSSSLSAATT